MAKKQRAYFRLTAPGAKTVSVRGSFNAWEPRPLKRQRNGVWTTWMMLEPGRYEYRFFVDGEWENDPAAETVQNEYGSTNCLLIVS